MYNFVHHEKVGIIFTDSYVESVHVGEMYNFVHLYDTRHLLQKNKLGIFSLRANKR